jgi:hypothetical protein
MMISGAPAWHGFIGVEDFVGRIIDVVLSCWPKIVAPVADEHEDPVTHRLVAKIKDDPTFRSLSLRVYPRPLDLDSDGNVTGIPDIRFETLASQHQGEFFVFECKRLRYEVKGKCRSNNSEYIDGDNQGMTAFVTEKYKTHHGHGGMIGYILCDCGAPMPSLEKAVRKSTVLALAVGGGLQASSLRPRIEVRETFHVPSSGRRFRLHHLFLDSRNCCGRQTWSGKRHPVQLDLISTLADDQ